MKSTLTKDLELLTSIKESYFNKLVEKAEWCICDIIEKSLMNDEDLVEVDLGIGVLTILIQNNSIKYRFTPSSELEENIVKVITEEINPLKLVMEKTLVSKLTNMYKELI